MAETIRPIRVNGVTFPPDVLKALLQAHANTPFTEEGMAALLLDRWDEFGLGTPSTPPGASHATRYEAIATTLVQRFLEKLRLSGWVRWTGEHWVFETPRDSNPGSRSPQGQRGGREAASTGSAADRKRDQRERMENAVQTQLPDKWSESVCLYALNSGKHKRTSTGEAAWERLGKLRGWGPNRPARSGEMRDVPMTGEELDTLCINGTRYCLGRMSYLVVEQTALLRRLWAHLSEQGRQVIQQDVEEALSRGAVGAEQDRQEWLRLARDLWGTADAASDGNVGQGLVGA